MFKTRVAMLGVLALFIVSGIATSTASAAGPFWHVAGSKLGQGTVKQVKLQAKGVTVLKGELGGLTAIIECRNSYSEGAAIEGAGNLPGQDKGRVVFEQCKVSGTANCTSVDEPIKTNQVKSYLAYNKGAAQQKYLDVFTPQQGNNFVTLNLHGGILCGPTAVEGSAAAEVIPNEKESQEGLLNFPAAPITSVVYQQQEQTIGLKFAGTTAIFSGTFGARLATNEQWGVFGQ